MTDPYRDPVRRASASAGIAEARARLLIRWDRDAEKWFIGEQSFDSLLDAENSLTRPPEGEQ